MNKALINKIKILLFRFKTWFGITFLHYFKYDGYDYGHAVDNNAVEYVRIDENAQIHHLLKVFSVEERAKALIKILEEANKLERK
jgi:hypothetical protein